VSSHVTVDGLQLTLAVTFHYLFPILTMGSALFIAWLKTVSHLGGDRRRLLLFRKTDEERAVYDGAAHFWATIFGITFVMGRRDRRPRWSSSSPRTGPRSRTTRAA
jgi:cytochrome bd-type quinol oxidase subunit 1